MEISNKTKLPLRVPLPGGKKLFLGPGRAGQITPKAAEFPPLKKLLDAGDIAITAGGPKGVDGPGHTGVSAPQRGPSGGAPRHTGDR